MTRTVELQSVAENPRVDTGIADDDVVSFLAMQDVSESGTTSPGRDRPFREVKRGYTPFRSDVLFAKITPCFENGKIGQALTSRPNGYGSTEFHVVRPIDGVLDPRYIHHFLRPQVRSMGELRMTGSAGQRRVPTDFVARLRVPLPVLAEQSRIAAILDQSERIRSLRMSSVEGLEHIAASLLGRLLQKSKSERVAQISSLGQVQSGLTINSSRARLTEQYPYLRVANVFRGRIDLGVVKEAGATDAERDRAALRAGDLLIVEGHGNPEEVGRIGLWDGSIDNCLHQNHLIRVRLDQSKLDPVYALHYLNSNLGRRHLLRSAKTTSGLNTISTSQVRATPVRVPPIDDQRAFAARVRAIDECRQAYCLELTELDSLFASLQHRAFRGEL